MQSVILAFVQKKKREKRKKKKKKPIGVDIHS